MGKAEVKNYVPFVRVRMVRERELPYAMEEIDGLSQDFSFCKPYRSPERTRNLIQEFLDSTQLSVVQKP